MVIRMVIRMGFQMISVQNMCLKKIGWFVTYPIYQSDMYCRFDHGIFPHERGRLIMIMGDHGSLNGDSEL